MSKKYHRVSCNNHDARFYINNDISNDFKYVENMIKQMGGVTHKNNNKIINNTKLFNETLDIKNPLHHKIIILYASLDTKNIDEKILQSIKNIYNNYASISVLSTDDKCKLILTDIFINDLSDFTLKFENSVREIKCTKLILKFIPFFDIIFDDLLLTDSITLPTNFDITNIIIQIIYEQDTKNLLIPNSALNILFQMDIWLMKSHMNNVLVYIHDKLDEIIAYELGVGNYGNVIGFYNLLGNLINEKVIDNNEFSFGKNTGIINHAKMIKKEMGHLNIHPFDTNNLL